MFGACLDLARGLVDLAREVADQRQRAVQSPPRRLAQLELAQKVGAGPEHVAVGARDAALGEDRPDAVLER